MKELVSVIMPSYNTAKYIGETIKSVQAQTYENWELIIVDDCSTDNTDTAVEPFLSDERIRYLKTAATAEPLFHAIMLCVRQKANGLHFGQ